MKLSELKLNPDNPRLIKDEKFKKLCERIKANPEFLKLRPIIVDKDNVIIGGNMRYRALKELGYTELKKEWVKKADELTDEQRREFIIIDNNSYGEMDWEIASSQYDLKELEDWGVDVPDFLTQKEVEEDDFEVPPMDQIQTSIVLGDVIEIGQHRLVCGDSTEADTVAKLLQGKDPYLMVTDPPYGVEYDPNWRKEHNETKGFASKTVQTGLVQNDDKADWAESWALSPAKVAYVWHGDRHAAIVQQSLESCDFVIRCQIVWNKMFGVFGRGDYHWQHEPCWYAVKKGSKGNWAGDRKQTTVWDIKGFNPNGNDLQKKEAKTGHGTQKPVECMGRAIGNHDGDVYDPFLGSGTTMVAAHQLGRKCYGIEIDPKYCQIIIDRMLKVAPELDVRVNGKPYEVTAAETA